MSQPIPAPSGFLSTATPGTRVVVRYRIEDGLTDALGHLLACDAGACTIRTRQADVVIPLDLVVAAKEVPPAPERRRPRA
ncbi:MULTISPECIES: hypothetical protein [Micrococcaceae]|uniref:putative acetyltransferase n=1 Tax=Micrococcaceae TaxID=1268 RepID=UPI00138042B5|nr:hypothetical protein [Pseudarthrobacter oxydans]MUU72815.1 hypothetical protein [Pseudarthrobacter sp. GA104]WPU08224.1 hypothetical protein SMD14_13780 [Pseudarthrobacter oxydans]HET7784139.1 hypothetical protein [Arthrobacter sp.]